MMIGASIVIIVLAIIAIVTLLKMDCEMFAIPLVFLTIFGFLCLFGYYSDEPYVVEKFTKGGSKYTQCKSIEEVVVNGEKIIMCEFISNNEKAKNK